MDLDVGIIRRISTTGNDEPSPAFEGYTEKAHFDISNDDKCIVYASEDEENGLSFLVQECVVDCNNGNIKNKGLRYRWQQ